MTVTFGGATAADLVVVSATELTCTAPACTAAGAVDVVVTTSGGSATLAGGYTCASGPDAEFKRGDVNADGDVNIADAIALLGHLFGGGPAPVCPDAADGNDDGALNIADAIAVLDYLFGGAGSLPEPFGTCGVDPTPDALDECDYPPANCQ
jgi:hypothetical protein